MTAVSFHVVGGPIRNMVLETDNEWANLVTGNVLEIYHSNQNWTGTYKVLHHSKYMGGIKYTILLTSVELKHTTDGHNKKWSAFMESDIVGGSSTTTRVRLSWGKIGSTQQKITKTFSTQQGAAEFVHEKIAEKLKKGYNKR